MNKDPQFEILAKYYDDPNFEILVTYYKDQNRRYPIVSDKIDLKFKDWLSELKKQDSSKAGSILKILIDFCKNEDYDPNKKYNFLMDPPNPHKPSFMGFLYGNPLQAPNVSLWSTEYLVWLEDLEGKVTGNSNQAMPAKTQKKNKTSKKLTPMSKVAAQKLRRLKGIPKRKVFLTTNPTNELPKRNNQKVKALKPAEQDIDELTNVIRFYHENIEFFKAPFEQEKEFRSWVNKQKDLTVPAILDGINIYLNNLLPGHSSLSDRDAYLSVAKTYYDAVKNIEEEPEIFAKLISQSVPLSPRDQIALNGYTGFPFKDDDSSIAEYIYLLLTNNIVDKNGREQENILPRIIKAWSNREIYDATNYNYSVDLLKTMHTEMNTVYLPHRTKKDLFDKFQDAVFEIEESLSVKDYKERLDTLENNFNYLIGKLITEYKRESKIDNVTFLRLLKLDFDQTNDLYQQKLNGTLNTWIKFSDEKKVKNEPQQYLISKDSEVYQRLISMPSVTVDSFNYNLMTYNLILKEIDNDQSIGSDIPFKINQLDFALTAIDYQTKILKLLFPNEKISIMRLSQPELTVNEKSPYDETPSDNQLPVFNETQPTETDSSIEVLIKTDEPSETCNQLPITNVETTVEVSDHNSFNSDPDSEFNKNYDALPPAPVDTNVVNISESQNASSHDNLMKLKKTNLNDSDTTDNIYYPEYYVGKSNSFHFVNSIMLPKILRDMEKLHGLKLIKNFLYDEIKKHELYNGEEVYDFLVHSTLTDVITQEILPHKKAYPLKDFVMIVKALHDYAYNLSTFTAENSDLQNILVSELTSAMGREKNPEWSLKIYLLMQIIKDYPKSSFKCIEELNSIREGILDFGRALDSKHSFFLKSTCLKQSLKHCLQKIDKQRDLLLEHDLEITVLQKLDSILSIYNKVISNIAGQTNNNEKLKLAFLDNGVFIKLHDFVRNISINDSSNHKYLHTLVDEELPKLKTSIASTINVYMDDKHCQEVMDTLETCINDIKDTLTALEHNNLPRIK